MPNFQLNGILYCSSCNTVIFNKLLLISQFEIKLFYFKQMKLNTIIPIEHNNNLHTPYLLPGIVIPENIKSHQ